MKTLSDLKNLALAVKSDGLCQVEVERKNRVQASRSVLLNSKGMMHHECSHEASGVCSRFIPCTSNINPHFIQHPRKLFVITVKLHNVARVCTEVLHWKDRVLPHLRADGDCRVSTLTRGQAQTPLGVGGGRGDEVCI